MTQDQETILLIKGAISELPDDQQKECKDLILSIKAILRTSDDTIGTLVIALIGAELQAENPE